MANNLAEFRVRRRESGVIRFLPQQGRGRKHPARSLCLACPLQQTTEAQSVLKKWLRHFGRCSQNSTAQQRKAESQMEWVRQMNACKTQAEAIAKLEWIYDGYRARPGEKCSGRLILTVDFLIIFWYDLFEKV